MSMIERVAKAIQKADSELYISRYPDREDEIKEHSAQLYEDYVAASRAAIEAMRVFAPKIDGIETVGFLDCQHNQICEEVGEHPQEVETSYSYGADSVRFVLWIDAALDT